MTAKSELRAGLPSLVALDLPALDLVADALREYNPPRGQRREHSALIRKICKIRDRKRARAMRR